MVSGLWSDLQGCLQVPTCGDMQMRDEEGQSEVLFCATDGR